MCQEKMLGLKYNFNSHRAYILERKIDNKHAKTKKETVMRRVFQAEGLLRAKVTKPERAEVEF